MQYNPTLYNISRLSQAYYRYFEVALGYWLTHGNTSYSSDDFVTYSSLLGGQVDPTFELKKPNFQGLNFHSFANWIALVLKSQLVVRHNLTKKRPSFLNQNLSRKK